MATFRTQKGTEKVNANACVNESAKLTLSAKEITNLQTQTADAIKKDVPSWLDFEDSMDAIAYLTRDGLHDGTIPFYNAMDVIKRIACKTILFQYAYIGTEYYVPWKNTELTEEITAHCNMRLAELTQCQKISITMDAEKRLHVDWIVDKKTSYDVTVQFMQSVYRWCHELLRMEHAQYRVDYPVKEDGTQYDIGEQKPFKIDYMHDIRACIKNESDRVLFDMIIHRDMNVTDMCNAMKWNSRTSFYKAVKRIANDIGDYHDVLMDIAHEQIEDCTIGNTLGMRKVSEYKCVTPNINRKRYIKQQMKRWTRMLTKQGITGTELAEKLANVEQTLTPKQTPIYTVNSYHVEDITDTDK